MPSCLPAGEGMAAACGDGCHPAIQAIAASARRVRSLVGSLARKKRGGLLALRANEPARQPASEKGEMGSDREKVRRRRKGMATSTQGINVVEGRKERKAGKERRKRNWALPEREQERREAVRVPVGHFISS